MHQATTGHYPRRADNCASIPWIGESTRQNHAWRRIANDCREHVRPKTNRRRHRQRHGRPPILERLVEFDTRPDYQIVTFCEEPRHAYDRVHLTDYFSHRDAAQLQLAGLDWYEENGVSLFVGDRAERIDRKAQVVYSQQGREVPYDILVLATGSAPFVPAIPGVERQGVYVYRTIEDLEKIIADHHRRAGRR